MNEIHMAAIWMTAKATNPAMRNDTGDDEDERRQEKMPTTENAPIKTVSAISTGENDPLKNVTIPAGTAR